MTSSAPSSAVLDRVLANAKIGRWSIRFIDGKPKLTLDDYLLSLYGLPPEKRQIDAVFFINELFHPDEGARVLQELTLATRTPHYSNLFETRARNYQTGEYRWVRVGFTCGALNAAGFTDIDGVSFDINGDDLYQQHLRLEEERLHKMLDGMPMSCHLWVIKNREPLQFYLVDCNQPAVDFFGFTDKESSLRNFAEASPEFQPTGMHSMVAATEYLKEALATGQVKFEWRHRNVATGADFPAEITLVHIKYRGDDAILGYMRNLTEEIKRRQLEEQTRIIVDNMPISCSFWDHDFNLLYCNPRSATLFGFANQDDYLRNLEHTMPPQQANGLDTRFFMNSFVSQAFTEGTAYCEIERRKIDGSPLWLATFLVRSSYQEREVVIAFSQDLTATKKALHDLAAARDYAEQNLKIKNEFIANMSHEIRTPLNGIVGFLHLLTNAELGEREFNFVKKIEGSAQALLRVVNDILDFSKIEAGELSAEKTSFDLLLLINEVLSSVSAAAAAKNLTLAAPSLPIELGRVYGDAARLKQVLLQLLQNALKFTHTGGVELVVAPLQFIAHEVIILFKIKDTGIGIPSEHLPYLFTAFCQADGSTTRRYGGMGLGLAICKRLVEALRGEIWCESTVDVGTTFNFTVRVERMQN